MKFLSALFVLFMIVSCTEPLDFGNSQFYDLDEVLESPNCTADCEEEADCENVRAKIIAIIDESNINAAENQFFILDRSDSKIEMEVKVDSMESAVIFSLISDKGGETVRIQGLLGGVDGSSSSNCQREIFINLADVADIEIIE